MTLQNQLQKSKVSEGISVILIQGIFKNGTHGTRLRMIFDRKVRKLDYSRVTSALRL